MAGMIPVTKIDAPFEVNCQGCTVNFDALSQKQVLSFKFTLDASLSELLTQLLMAANQAPPQGIGQLPPQLLPQDLSRQPPPQHGMLPAQTPTANIRPCREPPLPAFAGGPQRAPPARESQHIPPVSLPTNADNRQPQLLGSSGGWTPLPFQQPAGLRLAEIAAPLPFQHAAGSGPENVQLLQALQNKDVVEARSAIHNSADVNCVEQAPPFRTPLFYALEGGGQVEIVNVLFQARANVNAAKADGTTPLHNTIQQYFTLPPVVHRMLLCERADINLRDSRGSTPLELAKALALRSARSQGGPALTDAEVVKVRQLLNELSEQPTVAVVSHDHQEVKHVLFADTENNKVIFHTESSIGLHSLKERRSLFTQMLRQQARASRIQHVAVNPELGTIAVSVEILENNQEICQNVIIVWPNGQIQDEEPLKLSINVAITENRSPDELLPACVAMSRCMDQQMLLSRLTNGQVYCWRLNGARSQLVSEVQLMDFAGLIAISDDGCWIAAVNKANPHEEVVQVWLYEGQNGVVQNPKCVHSFNSRPTAMTITAQTRTDSGAASCLLAWAEAPQPGNPDPPPILVYSITAGGESASVYMVKCKAGCHSLKFCHGTVTHLVSGHDDGLVIIYDLPNGMLSLSHDNQRQVCIDVSTDRKLMVSAETNYFRVYKVPALETS